jgi:hypothetical protein
VSIGNGQFLHHRSDRRPLHESRRQRAEEEAPVPHRSHSLAAFPELEGDTAEDQPEQHQRDRQIECRQKNCIDHREGGEQAGSDQDQPGLVAVPERGDGVHHREAVLLAARGTEQDADAEVVAVEDDIDLT